MEREKLLEEYKATLESLVAKTEFIYSEEFYKLDEFDRQKYQKDKMATEGHLSTLCNLLWGKTPQINSITDLFAMSIIGSMLGGSSFGSMPPMPKLDEKDFENKNEEKVFAIPTK